MDVSISPLDPSRTAHVQLYRSIRLRALEADPDAFGSTFERESAFDDSTWQERIARLAGRPGVIFVARLTAALQLPSTASMAVGVVGIGESAIRGDATLWGMWVAPTARGHGASGQLLDATERWVSDRNIQTTSLWVHHSNAPAIALYERRGFELQSEVGSDAPPACEDEQRMILYAAAP
jgi:ribosomal protein S18 acetylase RimI-like enzyme